MDKKSSRENSFCLLRPCPRHNVLEIHAQNAADKKGSVYILLILINGRQSRRPRGRARWRRDSMVLCKSTQNPFIQKDSQVHGGTIAKRAKR